MRAAWLLEFGLPESSFWRSTPREFMRLQAAWEQRENRAFWRAGTIASVIANAFRAENSPPVGPEDFFPSLKPSSSRYVTSEEAQRIALGAAELGLVTVRGA